MTQWPALLTKRGPYNSYSSHFLSTTLRHWGENSESIISRNALYTWAWTMRNWSGNWYTSHRASDWKWPSGLKVVHIKGINRGKYYYMQKKKKTCCGVIDRYNSLFANLDLKKDYSKELLTVQWYVTGIGMDIQGNDILKFPECKCATWRALLRKAYCMIINVLKALNEIHDQLSEHIKQNTLIQKDLVPK